MDERFSELLRRYKNNSATDLEKAELMQLVREGDNRDVLENSFDDANETPDEKMSADELAEVRRNILTEIEPSRSKNSSSLIWVAASALIILTISGAWFYNQRSVLQQNAIAEQEKIFKFSGKDFITLPDGTKVLMNEGSELIYASSFGEKDREVTLSGEAFFDVAHDPIKRFKVHTGKVVTSVLGTAFNVNSAAKDNVTVTVVRGKVSVGDTDDHTYGTITPNEQIAVNTQNYEFVKEKVDSQTVVEWKNNTFILDHVTFEQAAIQIEKRFNCKVTIANEQLKKCVVIAWYLNNESLQQIVEGLSSLQQASVSIKGNHIIIDGGVGCKSE
jgi:ferric-dicitrate binding protein FerR (iron transport regulator)